VKSFLKLTAIFLSVWFAWVVYSDIKDGVAFLDSIKSRILNLPHRIFTAITSILISPWLIVWHFITVTIPNIFKLGPVGAYQETQSYVFGLWYDGLTGNTSANNNSGNYGPDFSAASSQ